MSGNLHDSPYKNISNVEGGIRLTSSTLRLLNHMLAHRSMDEENDDETQPHYKDTEDASNRARTRSTSRRRRENDSDDSKEILSNASDKIRRLEEGPARKKNERLTGSYR